MKQPPCNNSIAFKNNRAVCKFNLTNWIVKKEKKILKKQNVIRDITNYKIFSLQRKITITYNEKEREKLISRYSGRFSRINFLASWLAWIILRPTVYVHWFVTELRHAHTYIYIYGSRRQSARWPKLPSVDACVPYTRSLNGSCNSDDLIRITGQLLVC